MTKRVKKEEKKAEFQIISYFFTSKKKKKLLTNKQAGESQPKRMWGPNNTQGSKKGEDRWEESGGERVDPLVPFTLPSGVH